MTIYDADTWDAEFRVFTYPANTVTAYTTIPSMSALITAGITTSLSGWTAPDTGKPTGWTEITSRTSWAGNFKTQLRGATIDWEAQLSGENFDDTLLGLGCPVVMWRRYWITSGWQAWTREYFGQFVASDYTDDYRNGQPWRRSVAGIGYNIGRKNASRMEFGPFDVMAGATVTASDTLTDVALETDKTEFYGGLANVDPSNLTDGKLNTVWISDSTPLLTEDFWDPGEGRIIYPSGENEGVLVSEVFFAPAGGQSPSTAWWIEVYNARAWGGITTVKRWHMTIGYNPAHTEEYATNMTVAWIMPEEYGLTTGRFGIICGSRSIFEKVTGGAPRAQFIFDVSTAVGSTGSIPALDQTDGFVTAGGNESTIIWAPAGATRKVQLNNSLGSNVQWNGGGPTYPAVATFDSDDVGATSGYSIRRVADDYMEDDADPAHFELNMYPSPGAHSSDRDGVALFVELPENTDALKAQITTSSTTVELKTGTLKTLPSGSIYVEGGDTFAYTGRTGNILTGVTGISGTHAADTQIWNYGAYNMFGTSPSATPTSAKQTGYPIDRCGWLRRKTPVPQYWRMYNSYLASDGITTYGDPGWRNSWYAQQIQGGDWPADGLSWSVAIANNSQPWAWTRCFLLVIDQMNGLGRAKLNELTAHMARVGVWIGATGTGTVGSGDFEEYSAILSPTSDGVFYYLLHDYMGMVAGDLDYGSSDINVHQLATFAIGLRPLTEVLDDLARMTGCLFYPSPSGIVYWLDDRRWPLTGGMADASITSADIRGELQWSDNKTACDYIILNVAIPYGESILHERILYPAAGTGTEPASGLQGEEIDGYAIGSRSFAELLAARLFWERQTDGTATFTAKAASALRAGQLINVTYDWDGSGSAVARRYMVEEVEELRSGVIGARKLAYRVTLRRYFW